MSKNFERQSLVGHMKRKCGGNEKTIKCEVCGKVFFTLGDRTAHMRDRHNAEEVVCEHCGKKLYKPSLRNHMAYHCPKLVTKEKLTCHICGKSVVLLDKHIEQVHGDPLTKKKFTCEVLLFNKLTVEQTALKIKTLFIFIK